jgi:hypothetical protein
MPLSLKIYIAQVVKPILRYLCVSPVDLCSWILPGYESPHQHPDLDHRTNITTTLCGLTYSTEENGEPFNGYVYEAKLTGIIRDNSLKKDIVIPK